MPKKKRKNEEKEPTIAGPNVPVPFEKSPALLYVFFTVALIAQSAFAVYLLWKSPGDSQPEEEPLSELDRILALSDVELEKVSTARINLLISQEAIPDLNIEDYQARFDQLVLELKLANQRHGAEMKDPDKLIRVLNTFLYLDKGFRYARLGDSTDPSLLSVDPRNLFLYGILDRMQGTCISMPVLYIALGEAVGLPIKGVNANDHFFCRWDGHGYVSNIEPTGGGGWSPDEDYIRDMKISKEQLRSGAYMRSLTKRELIGNFFFARASFYSATGRPDKALEDFARVVACNPRDVDGYANLAKLSAHQARLLGKRIAIPSLTPDEQIIPALTGLGGTPSTRNPGLRLPDTSQPNRDSFGRKIPAVPHPSDLVPDPSRTLPGYRRRQP